MAAKSKTVDRDEVFQEHVRTWNGFTKFMQYSVVAVVVLLVLMAIFLL